MRHHGGLVVHNGGKGFKQGGLGGVGRCRACHRRRWGWLSLSIVQTMHFNEHSCSLSFKSVSLAVDSPCMLVTALLTVSGVSAAVWVLDEAKVIVSGAVAAVFIIIVGGDMAVVVGSSGRKFRGCGGCRGAVQVLSTVLWQHWGECWGV